MQRIILLRFCSKLPQRYVTCASSSLSEIRPGIIKKKAGDIVAYYEDCIGITELQKARNEVTQWEERLYQAQSERRQKQADIKRIQTRLKEIHGELDRTARGEDKYLHLITEEHSAIKEEQRLLTTFEEFENKEREAFSMLSNRVSIFKFSFNLGFFSGSRKSRT